MNVLKTIEGEINVDGGESMYQQEGARHGDPELHALTVDNQEEITQTKATILVVGLFDGTDEKIEDHKRVLEDVGTNALLQRRSLRFTWIDADCYPEIGQAFGISQYPQALAINNVKQTFALHPSGFEEQRIAPWVSKFLRGAPGMRALGDRSIKLDGRDCKAIQAKKLADAKAAIDAEGDMDDILAEMAAEEVAKVEKEKLEAEAAEEAARAAKAAGKKKKTGKKGKKGKAKKKTVEKDEL